MLSHLEAGWCDSGIDEGEIEDIVFSSYLSDQFVNNYGYFCPKCEREVETLSGLYQHAEDTQSCSYLLTYPHCLARMSNQIKNRAH